MNEDEWTAPTQRLGFVNVFDSVLYVRRNPVRRYKVGLSKENLSLQPLNDLVYPRGAGETLRHVTGLSSIELGDCIMGKYPTFEEACKILHGGLGVKAIAFDRQFALTSNGYVYYKTTCVGRLAAKPKSINDIVFKAAFTHLVTLLENNYEKALSATRS